jgi:hypothetical protein
MFTARTSKSQLFHYFPDGREQLLAAVARHEADRVLADQQPYLSGLTSWRAWTAWRNAVVERYRAQGRHCPLSMLVFQYTLQRQDIETAGDKRLPPAVRR